MPELTTLLIIGGITLAVFGGGAMTAVRMLSGRKANDKDNG